ncbi:MAG: DUF2911 domain-containing protein [Bacteroidetes bacterium]|nr:DUF2911 domain-containing protein [Bacteroidota bacterium]
MKQFLFVVCLLLAHTVAFAQLELPQSSPKASVSYRVGLTDVTVNYSSPAVRKRPVYGALVPYGKVWRAGANKCTDVTFGTPVMIGKNNLSKGKYGFFLIPKEGDTWTAIFNSDFEQWGAYQYKEEKDIARLDVAVEALAKPVEHLTYRIEDRGIDQGAIVFEWERKRVSIPFTMETMKMAMANIDKGVKEGKADDQWWIHADAAEFLLKNNGDPKMALEHINKSVELKPQVWNLWMQAQIQAKNSDFKSALATVDKVTAASKTSKDEGDYFKELEKDINSAVMNWKKGKM